MLLESVAFSVNEVLVLSKQWGYLVFASQVIVGKKILCSEEAVL